MSDRRNLVIVRAGEQSIHPSWLNAPTEARNWDLIVSYFGKDPEKYRGADWIRADGQGLKFQALYDLISSQEDLIRRYDYIWFPDEDLACTCRDINRFFDRCRERKLVLAQPALTPDSYFAHAITIHSPYFQIRYTTFVEIMAPCLNSETLWKLLPTFKENHSGYALDYLWPTQLGKDASRIAIVDDVLIRHTRPIGGGQYYQVLQSIGRNAYAESAELLKKHGISGYRFWVRRGVLKTGAEIPDGVRLRCFYGLGLLLAIPRLKMDWYRIPRFFLSGLWQQIKGRRSADGNARLSVESSGSR